jgi:hypothetical protein
MSTTLPIDLTDTSLQMFIGTAIAVTREELGRLPNFEHPPDLVGAHLVMMALNGQTVDDMRAWVRAGAEWKQKHPPATPVGPADHAVGPATARTGLVHADGHVFTDDQGAYLAVGASLFWAGWGCRNDRDRLVQNLAFLRDQRVDYVRAIAVVGPTGWTDRTMPASDIEQTIGSVTDLAAAHGLRVAWSLFGNVDTAPSAADRERVVRLAAAQIAARPSAVQYVEIANEGWQTGFAGDGGIAEMRNLARILRDAIPHLVSLTSPQTDQDVDKLYDGSVATLMGVHPDRNITGQGGLWRPVRQAWDYRDSRRAWVIDEPIGQKSTVAEDFDPTRQAMAAAHGWLIGAAAYVVHAGAGIRGGGREDRDRGREANWFEVPGARDVFAAIDVMRDMLPRDLPNFQHHNSNRNFPGYPFDVDRLIPILERNGMLRAFGATAGDGRLVILPMLAVEPVPFTARRAMHLDVRTPLGALVESHDLAAGATFTLPPTEAAVLIGR